MVVGRFTLAFQAFADAGPAMSIEAQEKLHKAVANRNFRFNDATGTPTLRHAQLVINKIHNSSLI